MAVGDINRVQLYTHVHQKQFVNVLHYRETVEDTGDITLQGLTDAWATQFITDLKALYSNELTFGCVKANQIVSSGTRKLPGVTYFLNEIGGVVGRAMPGNTVARVNFFGQNQGRVNRGGLNIGGMYLEEEEVNGPSAGAQVVLTEGWIDQLQVDVVGGAPSTGEWEFGWMSRAAPDPVDPLLPWPGQFVVPTGYTVSPFFSTLRSRQGTFTNVVT